MTGTTSAVRIPVILIIQRPPRTWGVRPLSETGGEPNAPRRHNPGRVYRSRRRSGLSTSNERPAETSAFAVGHSFADAAAIADAVVIAMGPWSILAAKWLPLPPVFGLKGHSLVFQTGATIPPEALFL
jgi:hypothetical protein